MRLRVNERELLWAWTGAALLWCIASGCGGGTGMAESTGGASGAAAASGGTTASGGTSGEGGAAGAPSTGGSLGSSSGGGSGAGALGGVVETGGVAGGHAGGSSGAGGAAGRAGSEGGAAGHGGSAGAGQLSAVTVWIAGDSTVMTYQEPNTQGNNMVSLYGWGQEIGRLFNSKVTINNQAIGGRSVAFFMWSVVQDSSGNYQCVDTQGTPEFQMSNGNKVNTSQWSRILAGIKAGDFLLIQFGTNDETHTCPRYVALPDFEADLGFMADAVRAKGATPIFVTPMGHRTFSGTTATNTLLPYANAMKDEASKKSIEVEDLNLESEAYYTSVGDAYLAANIFDGGTTHFTEAGAMEMATLIVKEIRKNNGPLAAYLNN